MMAYNASDFGTMPKALRHLDESPREAMVRSRESRKAYKRYLLYLITAVVSLFWLKSFISIPKQTDRVPFRHDPIEEYNSWALKAVLFTILANDSRQLLQPFRRSSRMWHRFH